MADGEVTNFCGGRSIDEGLSPIAQRIEALTEMVGSRIRRAREIRGLSRRELSEKSDVSQRYLAQIEAGKGNISIALLLRVGAALGQKTEWFVGEKDPWTSDMVHVAELYRRASQDQRDAVLRVLDPKPNQEKKAQRIALIGLRGAGKSTLGRLASVELRIPFVELNDQIEEQSGMPISDVMDLYGQEGYRALEHQAMSRVMVTHECVILAVAGGIVSAPDSFRLLLDNYHTIWLRASPADHMSRVLSQGDHRPMAGSVSALDELVTILASREKLYANADATLETSGKSETETVGELLSIIEQKGFLR